jgi:hypothetical protein
MTDQVSPTFAFACRNHDWWELILDARPRLPKDDEKAFGAAKAHVLHSTRQLLLACWDAFCVEMDGEKRYSGITSKRPTPHTMNRHQWWYQRLVVGGGKSTWFGVALDPAWGDDTRIRLFSVLEGPASQIGEWEKKSAKKSALSGGLRWEDRHYFYGGIEIAEGSSMSELARDLVRCSWKQIATYAAWAEGL